MTNPCGHMLCAGCSTQLWKVWKEDGTDRKRWPVCRTVLLSHLFAKPALFNCSILNQTSLFIWAPTSVYIIHNYGQSLLESLNQSEKILESILLFPLMNSVPSKLEKSLATGWAEYYETRRNNLTCTICALPTKFEIIFVARCGHFCTLGAAYTVVKRRETPIKCKECLEELQDEYTEIVFLRPS